MDNPIISSVVPGFKRVAVALGLKCPSCTMPLPPYALRHDGVEIVLRCVGCHADAITCELTCLPDEYGE